MNPTTLTTVLGMAQAIGAAIVDFFVHNPMDGGAMKQPTFWVGLGVAILMGLKAYYTQGIAKPGEGTQTPVQKG